ncbi:penicillin-binding protein activator [Bdellovibrionota bacterium FG-2]
MAKKKKQAGSITSTAIVPALNEKKTFRKIQDLFAKKNFETLIPLLEQYTKAFPQGTHLPQAENIHGLALVLTKQPALSLPHFRVALEKSPVVGSFRHYVLYNLSMAQFESEDFSASEQTLNELKLDQLDKDNQTRARYLKARLLQKNGAAFESARESLAATQAIPAVSETHTSLSTLTRQTLQEISKTDQLETLFKESEDSALADAILFRLGSLEISQKEVEKGNNHLRLMMSRFPKSSYYAQALDLVRGQYTESEVQSSAVGVLVPTNGKFARFSTRLIQGLEMGFGIFGDKTASPSSPAQNPDISLFIEDSGDTPEQALEAFDRLVTQHHVIAVIGPLLSKGIEPLMERSQQAGVPLLTLSRQTPQSSVDTVFHTGLTNRLQTQKIAAYAIQKLGLKRFAILAPKEKTAEDLTQQFWDAVESLGGEVVGVETYSPGETDFRQAVDKLGGLFYSASRQRELDALIKERDVLHIKKRTRKTEQYFSLKPIVDFDAVFIPEDPKISSLIIPTFAYRDIDHVRFLGISDWNSTDFPTRTVSPPDSVFFCDAFFLESSNPQILKFSEGYKKIFSMLPSSLEAVAYDTAKILTLGFSQGANTLSALKDYLKGIKGYAGIAGRTSSLDGHFDRELDILTLRSGKVAEVQPAQP